MWEQPTDDALAWAEICHDHDRLEKRAHDSGYQESFNRLVKDDGAGSPAEWWNLIEQIEEHERSTGDYVIRDPREYFAEPDDEPVQILYGCPTARACDRREHAGRGAAPPVCHLAGKAMAELGPRD